MDTSSFLGLVQNAALLLAVAFLFDVDTCLRLFREKGFQCDRGLVKVNEPSGFPVASF